MAIRLFRLLPHGGAAFWHLLVLVSLFFAITAIARADTIVCPSGSGADQCSAPKGVAVDRTEDLLYVADDGNKRVDVFEADGDFLRAFGWNVAPDGAPGDTPGGQLEVCTTVCQAGTSGGGGGQFSFLSGIAVDNDPTSTAFGAIYVYDGGFLGFGNNRVQRFEPDGEFVVMFGGKVNKTKVDASAPAEQQNRCPVDPGDVCQAGIGGTAPGHFRSSPTTPAIPRIALGPGGLVHVTDNIGGGDHRLQRFDDGGKLVSSCSPLAPGGFGEAMRAVAVDSTGSFYVAGADSVVGAVRKYDPSCNLLKTFHPSVNVQALATDAADNLLVADSSTGVKESVYRYDAAGNVTRVFYGDGAVQSAPNSVAPHPDASGDVFATEGGGLQRVLHVAFPPPGPVVHPDPARTEAGPVGNSWATLKAQVNPEGKATTFQFQYVDDASYDAEGGFASPNTKITASSPVAPPVSPTIVPDLFRLAPVSALAGCKPVEDPPQPSCLEPEAEYHFRVVAQNADGGPRIGPEQTLVTGPPFEILKIWSSAVGAESAKLSAEVDPIGIPLTGHFEYLTEAQFEAAGGFEGAAKTATIDFGSAEGPTIRAVQAGELQPGTAYRFRVVVENFYEAGASGPAVFATYAAPEDPELCANDSLRLGASARLPDCRAYEMVSPIDKEGGEIRVQPSPLFNLPADLNQSASTVPAEGRGLTYSSYRAYGDAVSAQFTSQYLASRHPLGHPEEGWSSHGISPPREGARPGSVLLNTQFRAFSVDLRYGWLRPDSEPPLEPSAIAGYQNLYRRDNATEEYRSTCPVEPPTTSPETFLPEPQGFSADGSVTVFRANDKLHPDASGAPIRQLYACLDGQLEVVSVLPPALGGEATNGNSAAGTGMNAPGDHRQLSLHNAVSAGGSLIYWTDMGGAADLPGKIYLRERPLAEGGECEGPTTPCTVAVSESVGGPGSTDKAHFWTASSDGSVAIFSFTAGSLSGNLYRFDAASEASTLIAEGVSGLAGWSEDAQRIYLVSTKALAPGAVVGQTNLYRYEAGVGFGLVAVLPGGPISGFCRVNDPVPITRCTRAAPDGDQLAFMSRDSLTGYDNTDATGGKADDEVFLYDATADGGTGELLCVSCNPSGGRPIGQGGIAARIPSWESAFQASRLLSADGRRLFFESFDSLLPTDANGALDVYQWERVGEGDCEEGDWNHFPQNGGCLALISSGRSPNDSEFVDASADGSDVFFKTASSLVSEDPGLLDIYDARIGGGFPPPPAPPPPCEGEACQSPPAPPQAPTPSSMVFQGPGDPKPRKCPKGKRRVVRAGKAGCVKKRKGARKAAGRAQRRVSR